MNSKKKKGQNIGKTSQQMKTHLLRVLLVILMFQDLQIKRWDELNSFTLTPSGNARDCGQTCAKRTQHHGQIHAHKSVGEHEVIPCACADMIARTCQMSQRMMEQISHAQTIGVNLACACAKADPPLCVCWP